MPATAGTMPGRVVVAVHRGGGHNAIITVGGVEFTPAEAEQLGFEVNRVIQISRMAVAYDEFEPRTDTPGPG